MLVMNSSMAGLYNAAQNEVLVSELRAVAEAGFKKKCGCFILSKSLDIDTNATVGGFPDKTGYECFLNSINIDEYVDVGLLEQGVAFAREVFIQWERLCSGLLLTAIFLLDEFGLKVKFHVWRDGEKWLADDLESYEESILVVDSSESSF